MKALAAVEETEDDRRARRLVFAQQKVDDLTKTINALSQQRASFQAKLAKFSMPDDHPALVACKKRRDEEIARRAGGVQ